MDLIVISKETFFKDETVFVNRLFENGMTHFHLRKPGATESELKSYISKISPDFHRNISLHQHHHLAEIFHIFRLHFTSDRRKNTTTNLISTLFKKGYILSTSSHTLEELNHLPEEYVYSFLSPVFDSISKPNYTGFLNSDFSLPERKNNLKIYGLGGIHSQNIQHLKQLNFDGAAVLGSLWKNPNGALNEFIKLKEVCYQTVQ